MPSLISVIIPTFNRASFIGETLDSLLAQTYKNWECIVVDDGSGDYTAELMEFYCEKDNRFTYCTRPRNRPKGANSCRNYGYEICKGEFVNWFDSDDILHHEKLEKQVQSLEERRYDFSVCQAIVFNGDRSRTIELRHAVEPLGDPFEDCLKMKVHWLTGYPLWRRKFLSGMKLFDENLQAAQEWEFHCRMIFFASDFYITEEPLVYVRKHSESVTYGGSEEKRLWNYFLARLKIFRNSELVITKSSELFLGAYLLNSYKYMVKEKSAFSFKAFRSFVLNERRFSYPTKFFAFLSILSYRFTGKGNFLLQKVKYDTAPSFHCNTNI